MDIEFNIHFFLLSTLYNCIKPQTAINKNETKLPTTTITKMTIRNATTKKNLIIRINFLLWFVFSSPHSSSLDLLHTTVFVQASIFLFCFIPSEWMAGHHFILFYIIIILACSAGFSVFVISFFLAFSRSMNFSLHFSLFSYYFRCLLVCWNLVICALWFGL